MNKRTPALWGLFFLASLSLQAAADVYKCSKMGQTIYSDQPCKRLKARTLEVLTPEKLEQKLSVVPSIDEFPNPTSAPPPDTGVRHPPRPRVTPPPHERQK